MLRLGIIGCGRVTKMFHLNAIEDASNVTVVALADTLKNSVAETMKTIKVEYGCTDYQDLLNNPFVDAVVINTPPSYHEEIVLDALQAKKHVICEKPLAQTILGCDRINRKKKETGLTVLPAHNYVFTPSITKLVELIETEKIGETQSANFYFENNLKFYNSVTNFRVTNKYGLIEDILPHILSVSNIFFRKIIEVTQVEWWSKSYDICDNMTAILKAENNIPIHIKMSWTKIFPRFKVIIKGTKGEIHTDLMMNPYKIKIKTNGEKIEYNSNKISWLFDLLRYKHPSFKNMYEHFEKLIRGVEKPRITIEDEIGILKVIADFSSWLEEKTPNEF
jgi:predicted dehydrogenase